MHVIRPMPIDATIPHTTDGPSGVLGCLNNQQMPRKNAAKRMLWRMIDQTGIGAGSMRKTRSSQYGRAIR